MNTEADVPDILPEAARIVFDCQTANDPARWIPLPKCRTFRHNTRRAAF